MKFDSLLTDIKYATSSQQKKELWDIEGIIKHRSNQKFKFDTRPIKKFSSTKIGKNGSFKTKSDKMVFQTEESWLLIDIPELHKYIKEKHIKVLAIEELISNLEWNIILPKI